MILAQAFVSKLYTHIVNHSFMRPFLIVFIVFFLVGSMYEWAYAQNFPALPDTLERELEEIRIEAARGTLTDQTAPFAFSRLSRSQENVQFEPGLSLDNVLRDMPGIWVNNRENYALGERMSVRGMGWRAAFGVRGIYVMLDGIPLTVPDGQTVLDVIDPAFIQSAEIIRGPSSSFWGNAGGGTLFLSTRNFSTTPTAFTRTYAGSFNTYKMEAGAATMHNGHRYQVFASYTDRQGFRENSQFQATRVGGNAAFALSEHRSLALTFAFVDAPNARHPGSLNRNDARETPDAANPVFLNSNAGKIWQQGQLGLVYHSETDWGMFSASGYGLLRALHNPLPFNDIEVDRFVTGTRLSLQNEWLGFRWGVGLDASLQQDDRRNYNYVENFQRGSLSLEQKETVVNTAAFMQLGKQWGTWGANLAVRADLLRFENEDYFLDNGDQSGTRTFSAVSPGMGVYYQIANAMMYANVATSFESPTTTELVNRPDMTGGFNPDISPERTIGFELGMRGRAQRFVLDYDVALFQMYTDNRLIPFQTEAGGDRVFFRNEGRTRHRGIETQAGWQALSFLRLSAGYTWSHYILDTPASTEGEQLRNNVLPGIPEHRMTGTVEMSYRLVWLRFGTEYVSAYYTDSANTAENDAYFVSDFIIGASDISLGNQLSAAPFLKVTNVTNVRYNTSVSINANFGRYFEPAAPRGIFAGFSLKFGS